MSPQPPSESDVEAFLATSGRLQNVTNFTAMSLVASIGGISDKTILVRFEGSFDDREGFDPVIQTVALPSDVFMDLAIKLIQMGAIVE